MLVCVFISEVLLCYSYVLVKYMLNIKSFITNVLFFSLFFSLVLLYYEMKSLQ